MKKFPNIVSFGNIGINNENNQQIYPTSDQKYHSKKLIKTLALGNLKEKDPNIVLTYQHISQEVTLILMKSLI